MGGGGAKPGAVIVEERLSVPPCLAMKEVPASAAVFNFLVEVVAVR
jgi:hypothetical protein